MQLPPRDPKENILNDTTMKRWLVFGLVQAFVGLSPYLFDMGMPIEEQQTMCFAIVSISTILMAISLRRDLTPCWAGPYFPFLLWMLVPAVITWLAVQWPLLQGLTKTTGLSGNQWLSVLVVSLIPPFAVEYEKTRRALKLKEAKLRELTQRV